MLRLTAFDAAPSRAADAADLPRLRLTYRERVRSRLAAMLPDGHAVAITLPRGSVMHDGAVLIGDDGVRIAVEAVAEPVARVTAASSLLLMRAVYHLANRHVPAQLAPDYVLIERDPVLEKMLLSLGCRIEQVDLPFDPEAGAYDGQHSHEPSHHAAIDDVSASVGEQLSIAAHRARSGGS